jgi:hypothetical protein
MSSCVCVASRFRMRKYAWLLVSALFVGCADLGPPEELGEGTIAGTVTEVPGGERINADISIIDSEGDVTLGRTVNGAYLIRRLLPDNYTVVIDPPNGYELVPGTLNNVPVLIEADEVETVNFQLRVAQ